MCECHAGYYAVIIDLSYRCTLPGSLQGDQRYVMRVCVSAHARGLRVNTSRRLLPPLALFKMIDMERGSEEGEEEDGEGESCCAFIEFLHLLFTHSPRHDRLTLCVYA